MPTDCTLCQQKVATGQPHWHRYHFSAVMDAALLVASRAGLRPLRRLLRTDPSFAGIPEAQVKRRAWAIGASKGAPYTAWLPEEEAVLQASAGQTYSLEHWQILLKRQGFTRSLAAIRLRLRHHGWTTRQGEWTLTDIAQGLGVSWRMVERWRTQGLLAYTVASGGTGATKYVSSAALRRFLVLYPHLASKGQLDFDWVMSLWGTPTGGKTRDTHMPPPESPYSPEGNVYAT